MRSWKRCWTRGRVPLTSLCSWVFLGRNSMVRNCHRCSIKISKFPLKNVSQMLEEAFFPYRYRPWRHHPCCLQTFWPQWDWLCEQGRVRPILLISFHVILDLTALIYVSFSSSSCRFRRLLMNQADKFTAEEVCGFSVPIANKSQTL